MDPFDDDGFSMDDGPTHLTGGELPAFNDPPLGLEDPFYAQSVVSIYDQIANGLPAHQQLDLCTVFFLQLPEFDHSRPIDLRIIVPHLRALYHSREFDLQTLFAQHLTPSTMETLKTRPQPSVAYIQEIHPSFPLEICSTLFLVLSVKKMLSIFESRAFALVARLFSLKHPNLVCNSSDITLMVHMTRQIFYLLEAPDNLTQVYDILSQHPYEHFNERIKLLFGFADDIPFLADFIYLLFTSLSVEDLDNIRITLSDLDNWDYFILAAFFRSPLSAQSTVFTVLMGSEVASEILSFASQRASATSRPVIPNFVDFLLDPDYVEQEDVTISTSFATPQAPNTLSPLVSTPQAAISLPTASTPSNSGTNTLNLSIVVQPSSSITKSKNLAPYPKVLLWTHPQWDGTNFLVEVSLAQDTGNTSPESFTGMNRLRIRNGSTAEFKTLKITQTCPQAKCNFFYLVFRLFIEQGTETRPVDGVEARSQHIRVVAHSNQLKRSSHNTHPEIRASFPYFIRQSEETRVYLFGVRIEGPDVQVRYCNHILKPTLWAPGWLLVVLPPVQGLAQSGVTLSVSCDEGKTFGSSFHLSCQP